MTAKAQTVKKELRKLRTLTHSIEATLRTRELHERRRAALREREATAEVKSELLRLERIIAAMSIEAESRAASELELKYMTAINSLEPIDKTIILDGYINGKPYWKIGRDIGYSERGIQERALKLLEKLAKMI